MQRLLIANRGEIACRIIQTARRMGLATVAVYSEADANARHVRLADKAINIGPALARESYLVIEKIIAAAKDTGADAIHPGYGFLSENASFAEAVTAAGLIFVGPSATAMRAMGDKAGAKQLMRAAGVPLLPGYDGPNQDDESLTREATSIGFPLLIKPSAGGGGKGMRLVHTAHEFIAELKVARREAEAAFGDSRIILERYLNRPRHVEVQVFGDSHGNVVHLFERDCTPQRRYQKVIEEAPATLPDGVRAELHRVSIAAAKAVNYTGAGTVEFLLDSENRPYFMEMNTRLQVEHPVTEMITGLDLVEWQLRVAHGEKLPLAQGEITAHGHAIEARLYAEDAAQNFLPQMGKIEALHFPALPDTRIDNGIEAGDTITPYYDPMVAKLMAHGRTRAEAIAKLCQLLTSTAYLGPVNNRRFLLALLNHPDFQNQHTDTSWLDRTLPALTNPRPAAPEAASLAARLLLAPAASAFRLNLPRTAYLELQSDEGALSQHIIHRDSPRPTEPHIIAGNKVAIQQNGEWYAFTRQNPRHYVPSTSLNDHHLRAPMPGRIIAVHIAEGQSVAKGAPLVTLEAMKMEHTLKAPGAGTVTKLRVAMGDQVNEGVELLEWEPSPS